MTLVKVNNERRTPSVSSSNSSSQESLDLTQSDVSLIAIMGVTGSGKSNFLRLITEACGNAAGPVVGHDLDSCTQKTEKYECALGGHQFVFFDTPGFDDTYRGDADILADVAQVLSSSYKSKLKLSGIIYLHRIKDERMTNAIMRNLSMFRNLCGDNAFKNVVLVTTFWDEIQDQARGEDREKQLTSKMDWWGYMTSKGSKLRRFDNTSESALSIVSELMGLPTITLQVQEEMVHRGLEVEQTTAGEALNRELLEQQAQFEEELQGLQREKEQAQKDHDVQLQQFLETMEAEKTALLREIEREQAALHADRREERRRMEQEFADERARLQRKLKDMIEESKRVKEDLEADARDDRRRMKLEFDEQIKDIMRQQHKRDQRRIKELEERLAAERKDSNQRLQDAFNKSNSALVDLKANMSRARDKDRRRYQEQILEIEKRQRDVSTQSDEWLQDMKTLSQQISEFQLRQKNAGATQWYELETRIQELESTKKEKTNTFWSSIGSLAGVGSLLLAII